MYIIFCIIVLCIGLVFINFGVEQSFTAPEYAVRTLPGVDFSGVQSSNVTPSSGNLNQKGLIPVFNKDLLQTSPFSVKQPGAVSKNTQLNVYSNLYPAKGFNYNNIENESNSVGGMGSPFTGLFKSGTTSSGSGQKGGGQGLLAVGSSGLNSNSNSLRSAPPNPFSDYYDNDITHPGGNPTGGPLANVPVGNGLLPMMLMAFSYLLFLNRKKFF
ncbi:MAG: hypothetical protein Q7J05_03700 [Paludibacter sp.]|nr:hypothetical protein [Paludibacter sp.]